MESAAIACFDVGDTLASVSPATLVMRPGPSLVRTVRTGVRRARLAVHEPVHVWRFKSRLTFRSDPYPVPASSTTADQG
jgi:hypothetical protein